MLEGRAERPIGQATTQRLASQVFRHLTPNLLKVGSELFGDNIGSGHLGQDVFEKALQLAELDQSFAQHENDVLKVGFKPARNLTQRDTVQVKDIDLQLAKSPNGASSFTGSRW
jgi:hypothetical protein